MPIDTMTITNTEEPVVLDVGEVLNTEVLVLVLFVWFVWNEASLGTMGVFADDVLEANVY